MKTLSEGAMITPGLTLRENLIRRPVSEGALRTRCRKTLREDAPRRLRPCEPVPMTLREGAPVRRFAEESVKTFREFAKALREGASERSFVKFLV